MKHPRRAAAVVTGVLAMSTCVLVGEVTETSSPRSTAAPISSTAQVTSGPSAEFIAPLHVPAPPTGVLGPEDGTGVLESDDDPEVLTPDDVVIPSPAPTAPRRAVVRPA